MNKAELALVPRERIENKIYLIRGKKVMFDSDIAELYGVETRVLNQAVRRNKERFPDDFVFQLNKEEVGMWGVIVSRSQIVTLKRGQNIKYSPYVFTEQGVAMLSSVLNSKRAILVNVQIIRTFTRLREFVATNKELREKLEKMEQRYDKQFKVVFDAIRKLLIPPDESKKRPIGF